MNHPIKYILLAFTVLAATACQDFEELQIDPNRATEVGPGLLLTNLEISVFNDITLDAALASRHLVYTQGASLTQYYGWQRAGFEPYEQLRQVTKMEEEAVRTENPNYLAIAKLLRSYIIVDLSQTFGDVPYLEAMSGFEGEYTPAYTPQEQIYENVLQELEEANNELDANNGEISGDLIYNGDIEQWKKLINSFKLRVLMSLSRKEGSGLDIEAQFREIFENPAQYPVMSSNADNAALPFYDREFNRYPYFNDNSIQTDYYLEESYLELLKERNDPRLFMMGRPDFTSRQSNADPNSFDSYSGLGGSASITENINRLNEGEGSPINQRYYNDPVNEPSISLGFPELAFTIAEAAQRGWISADPETYYNQGIAASMEFYGIDLSAIETYLQQPTVAFNAANGLEMILTQKYLSFFMNSGWEPFYNQRRTGIPEFSTDGEGILNGGRIPKRWMYPERELQLNEAHVVEAINRQFGSDDINGEMWLLQE
ncbi:SusD/RagB family nutrient-binding outer membrane lipoprotein [Catalinimonas niigatensis]|uniref:SusD/RagB family nutrient-binding outer membrane lipoprotein n=1 Tax=Catalinimonas niigatensis TaxID=1397264 RepID=UPI002666224C|nr:SusD/RagB family nutrient-binding outer membrane lipoprotein [Catalinimonas niigatensis]WPP51992.1 SusD/RagB family nutrient-binding outer membrane lipoprotein [Catalinimonas niigatensis]